MNVVAPHAAEHRTNAGHGAQEVPRVRVMVPGGLDDGEGEGTELRLIVADEGEIDFKAFWDRRIGHTVSDAVAMGLVGERLAERRQGLWAVGMLPMGQECTALACQVQASAPNVAGRAPLGRIDSGLRAHPAAPQQGDVLGINRVVLGLASMDGLHREGMTEDQWETLVSTEVGQPGPR